MEATFRIGISVLLIAALVLGLGSIFYSTTPVPDITISMPNTVAATQSWPEAMTQGYTGGAVSWGQFQFNCGDDFISFSSWTRKVSLPGKCPKQDVKSLRKALEKLFEEAKRLGYQRDPLFSELEVWIIYIARTFI